MLDKKSRYRVVHAHNHPGRPREFGLVIEIEGTASVGEIKRVKVKFSGPRLKGKVGGWNKYNTDLQEHMGKPRLLADGVGKFLELPQPVAAIELWLAVLRDFEPETHNITYTVNGDAEDIASLQTDGEEWLNVGQKCKEREEEGLL